MKKESGKVVVLASYNSIMEAQMQKTLLESAGINVRLQNEVVAQVLPVYGSSLNVNLLVLESDKERAEEVMQAKFDEEEFRAEEEAALNENVV